MPSGYEAEQNHWLHHDSQANQTPKSSSQFQFSKTMNYKSNQPKNAVVRTIDIKELY